MQGCKFRENKIIKTLNKRELERYEIHFLLFWADTYNYEKLKKWCIEKLKK